MPKIAIIKQIYGDCEYCDYRTAMGHDATNFTEVTDEELKILVSAARNNSGSKNAFAIIEMPTNQEELVKQTVADYLKEAKAKLKKEALDKKVREEKKRKSDLAKLAKSMEQKKALLEQLKQELGEIDR